MPRPDHTAQEIGATFKAAQDAQVRWAEALKAYAAMLPVAPDTGPLRRRATVILTRAAELTEKAVAEREAAAVEADARAALAERLVEARTTAEGAVEAERLARAAHDAALSGELPSFLSPLARTRAGRVRAAEVRAADQELHRIISGRNAADDLLAELTQADEAAARRQENALAEADRLEAEAEDAEREAASLVAQADRREQDHLDRQHQAGEWYRQMVDYRARLAAHGEAWLRMRAAEDGREPDRWLIGLVELEPLGDPPDAPEPAEASAEE